MNSRVKIFYYFFYLQQHCLQKDTIHYTTYITYATYNTFLYIYFFNCTQKENEIRGLQNYKGK